MASPIGGSSSRQQQLQRQQQQQHLGIYLCRLCVLNRMFAVYVLYIIVIYCNASLLGARSTAVWQDSICGLLLHIGAVHVDDACTYMASSVGTGIRPQLHIINVIDGSILSFSTILPVCQSSGLCDLSE